jgi:hypothetical protein
MLLPAKLPQCPISQLEIPTVFLGGSLATIVEMVICHLPCHWGASPDRWEKILPGSNGQLDLEKRLILLVS